MMDRNSVSISGVCVQIKKSYSLRSLFLASGILKNKKKFSVYLFKRTQTENKMLKDTAVF